MCPILNLKSYTKTSLLRADLTFRRICWLMNSLLHKGVCNNFSWGGGTIFSEGETQKEPYRQEGLPITWKDLHCREVTQTLITLGWLLNNPVLEAKSNSQNTGIVITYSWKEEHPQCDSLTWGKPIFKKISEVLHSHGESHIVLRSAILVLAGVLSCSAEEVVHISIWWGTRLLGTWCKW